MGLEVAEWAVPPPGFFPQPPYIHPQAPFGKVRRITLHYLWGSTIARNVFHVLVPNDYPDPFRQELLSGTFKSWWTDGFFGFPPGSIFQTSAATWARYVVHLPKLTEPLKWALEFELNIGLLGGGGQDGLPQNCTVAVGWQTGLPGPAYRGRTFYPFLVDAANDQASPGYLRPGVASDISGSYAGLLKQFYALAIEFQEPWGLLLKHRNMIDILSPYPTGTLPLTGTRMSDNALDSQWRRLPRHKHHSRK